MAALQTTDSSPPAWVLDRHSRVRFHSGGQGPILHFRRQRTCATHKPTSFHGCHGMCHSGGDDPDMARRHSLFFRMDVRVSQRRERDGLGRSELRPRRGPHRKTRPSGGISRVVQRFAGAATGRRQAGSSEARGATAAPGDSSAVSTRSEFSPQCGVLPARHRLRCCERGLDAGELSRTWSNTVPDRGGSHD